MSSTAVVMLTHNDHPRILRHFERLRTEAGIPAFRVRHVTEDQWSPCTEQDIPLRDEDLAASMPRRYAAMNELNVQVSRGYADMPLVSAASHPALSAFDRLWLLEYDVDYAGHWQTFFSRFAEVEADLVGFRFQRREDSREWKHWKTFAAPDGIQPLTGFIPAIRVTKTLVEGYRCEMEARAWGGHNEATVPSVALSLGFTIVDMGQGAEFSRFDDLEPVMDHATFGYRPSRSSSYSHEAPDNFPKSDMLYHPVKV